MAVGARIHQLGVHAHAIAGALNASFHHIRHSELLGDLTQITRFSALVLHHRRAADYFQVRDLSQVGQDFILNAVREVSVFFRIAQILKWKNSDALLKDRSSDLGKFPCARRRGSMQKRQETGSQRDCGPEHGDHQQ